MERYLMDVVVKDHLPEYLETLSGDINSIRQFMASNEKQLAEE